MIADIGRNAKRLVQVPELRLPARPTPFTVSGLRKSVYVLLLARFRSSRAVCGRAVSAAVCRRSRCFLCRNVNSTISTSFLIHPPTIPAEKLTTSEITASAPALGFGFSFERSSPGGIACVAVVVVSGCDLRAFARSLGVASSMFADVRRAIPSLPVPSSPPATHPDQNRRTVRRPFLLL